MKNKVIIPTLPSLKETVALFKKRLAEGWKWEKSGENVYFVPPEGHKWRFRATEWKRFGSRRNPAWLYPEFIREDDRELAGELEESQASVLYLRRKLEEIRAFGKNNPGCGYSCARMAEQVLKDDETEDDKS